MKKIKNIAKVAAKNEKNGIQNYYVLGHGITIDTKNGLILNVKKDDSNFNTDKYINAKSKILDLIEKDELMQNEYDRLVDGIDKQIDGNDELHDFYEVVLRVEKYEKEGK